MARTTPARPLAATEALSATVGATAIATAARITAKRTIAGPYADDHAYLEDELAWIEARSRRIGAENEVAGREDEDNPNANVFRHSDTPVRTLRSRIKRFGRDEAALRARIDGRLAAHRVSDASPLGLDRLVGTCELDDFERTVLLLAAAPCFSRRFEELLSNVDAGQMGGTPSVEVAFGFCEIPLTERLALRERFGRRGALVRNDLVVLEVSARTTSPRGLLDTEISITPRGWASLIGDDSLPEDLIEFSAVETARARLDQVVIAGGDKQRILSVVEHHDRYLQARADWGFDDVIGYGRGVLLLFHGEPGTGKTMMAHAIADHLGKRVLNVDIPTFVEHNEAARFLPALFREARLQNALLFFDECEALFEARRFGNALMTMLLTEIERFEGIAVLATNAPERLDEALGRRILVKVRFPAPDREARAEIWRRHLPAGAPIAADVDVEMLADRHDLTGGLIKNAVLMAIAEAVHGGADAGEGGAEASEGGTAAGPITMAMLDGAARQQACQVHDDTTGLVVPRARLADVILPAHVSAQVDELIAAARNRRTLLERWGIGAHMTAGKGVSALLCGPPGTGKTLCAEAIANELGRPLVVAAFPAIVSKWVGETQRNLARLFDDARRLGAVIFLDEADALLMERGEGNASRHDDAAVNVLLSLIERHEGVVLMATNRAATLDRALGRRLTERIEFPLPGPRERAAIWRRLLPDTVPVDAAIDFGRLGTGFAMAGGHIKNAVFRAAFRAANRGVPVSQALLEEAAGVELGQVEEVFAGAASDGAQA